MKKMVFVLAFGLLATSVSAIQAKKDGMTTQARALEGAKGTALAAFAAANCYILFQSGLDFLSGAAKDATDLKGKTFSDGAKQLFGSLSFVTFVGSMVWAGATSGKLSYEAFKKAIMNPKVEQKAEDKGIQPDKK